MEDSRVLHRDELYLKTGYSWVWGDQYTRITCELEIRPRASLGVDFGNNISPIPVLKYTEPDGLELVYIIYGAKAIPNPSSEKKGIKLQVSKWNELILSHKYHQIPRRDDLEIFCENDPHQSIWLRLLEKALAATPADLPHGRDGPGHGGGMITKGLVRDGPVSLPEAAIPAAAPSTMSSHAPPVGQPQVQAFQAGGGGVKEIMDKAFGLVESATRLEKLEDYPSAFKLYQQGIQLFRTVSPLIPDAKRRQLVESQCAELERRAHGVRKKQLEKASRDGLSGGRGDALNPDGKAGVSAGPDPTALPNPPSGTPYTASTRQPPGVHTQLPLAPLPPVPPLSQGPKAPAPYAPGAPPLLPTSSTRFTSNGSGPASLVPEPSGDKPSRSQEANQRALEEEVAARWRKLHLSRFGAGESPVASSSGSNPTSSLTKEDIYAQLQNRLNRLRESRHSPPPPPPEPSEAELEALLEEQEKEQALTGEGPEENDRGGTVPGIGEQFAKEAGYEADRISAALSRSFVPGPDEGEVKDMIAQIKDEVHLGIGLEEEKKEREPSPSADAASAEEKRQ